MTIKIGGGFSLTDHHGRTVTDASYRGKYMLLFFGFTHCRVVCPQALARISDALSRLGTLADEIQPIYVTVDPERDTPDAMRRFLERDYPRFIGLTGNNDEIAAMKATFKVFAARKEDPGAAGGYVVPHTAFTFLLDRNGGYVAHFVDAGDAGEIASKLSTWITVASA